MRVRVLAAATMLLLSACTATRPTSRTVAPVAVTQPPTSKQSPLAPRQATPTTTKPAAHATVPPLVRGPVPWVVEQTWHLAGQQTWALVVLGARVYRLSGDGTDNGSTTLSRIDPAGGHVLAARPAGRATEMVTVGGRLWLATLPPNQQAGPSTFAEVDPHTLVTLRTVTLTNQPGFAPTSIRDGPRSLTVAGGLIWFAFETDFRAIDPLSGRTVLRIHEPSTRYGDYGGSIGADPDGRHVWTAGYESGERPVPVEYRDARTGTLLAQLMYGAGGGLAPYRGGAWMAAVGGNESELVRLTVHSGAIDAEVLGGADNGLGVSLVDRVLWLSTARGMSCADVGTGRVLVQATGEVVDDYPAPVALDRQRFLVAVPSAGRTQTVVLAHARAACRA